MELNRVTVYPRARHSRLVIRETGDELLVYDLIRDQAHCLNATAAAVWNRCDGRTAVAEIAAAISVSSGRGCDESIVFSALDMLNQRQLLEGTLPRSTGGERMARRDLLRRVGLAATALAAPAITSIVAPTAAQAASCSLSGTACGTSIECCSRVCSSNVCL